MITLSPGAKKMLSVVVILLVAYWVITAPTESANLVQDLLGMLQEGAEAVITFLQSLFA